MKNKRFKVIACNVMWRELSYFAALSPHAFNLQFLDWGLHTEPDRLRQEVQKAIDATGRGYDAILLGYGLCSNGLEGDAGLIRRLVNGDWQGDDFLIVDPGRTIRASNDDAVLRTVSPTPASGKEASA